MPLSSMAPALKRLVAMNASMFGARRATRVAWRSLTGTVSSLEDVRAPKNARIRRPEIKQASGALLGRRWQFLMRGGPRCKWSQP